MKRILLPFLPVLLLGFAATSCALEGNPQRGATLAKGCSCHRKELHGASAEFLTQRLKDYRAGTGATQSMIRIASKLSDQDIAVLAADYSSQ